MTHVETTFSALSVWPSLTQSVITHGDFASSSRTRYDENKKIEEGIELLVRKEKKGNNIFKCWTCNEFCHYASKFPKREKKYKGKFKPKRDRNCLYANEDEESNERAQSESDDELGFVAIKEDGLDREIR